MTAVEQGVGAQIVVDLRDKVGPVATGDIDSWSLQQKVVAIGWAPIVIPSPAAVG